VLLDREVLIWHAVDARHLTKRAARVIENQRCWWSYASLWELAIKSGLRKVNLFVEQERVSAARFITYVASHPAFDAYVKRIW
jgi:PIN domain nuclease of toxin-antitoxin system